MPEVRMFFVHLGPVAAAVLEAELQRTAADHAADASCYMAGHWRRADDIIDVEAREVPEPGLIGYVQAADE